MKLATVFGRTEAFYIQASSRSESGVWVFDGDCIKAPRGEPSYIGRAVLRALARSRTGPPHSTDWRAPLRPVLEVSGQRTWNAFAKGATAVEVSLGDEGMVFTPTINLGSRGGFRPVEAQALRLPPDAGEVEIASALDTAFSHAE
jgi:hypothetical protein